MLLSEVKRILVKHKKELMQRGADTLALFGSVARNEATNESDVDILIDFDSNKGMFQFVNLKRYLKNLLGCEVDLVSYHTIRPALKERILHEAKRVF